MGDCPRFYFRCGQCSGVRGAVQNGGVSTGSIRKMFSVPGRFVLLPMPPEGESVCWTVPIHGNFRLFSMFFDHCGSPRYGSLSAKCCHFFCHGLVDDPAFAFPERPLHGLKECGTNSNPRCAEDAGRGTMLWVAHGILLGRQGAQRHDGFAGRSVSCIATGSRLSLPPRQEIDYFRCLIDAQHRAVR